MPALRDPNSARNRWRRKRAAFLAYGWGVGVHSSFPSLRSFIRFWPRDAYSAGPSDLRETFAELRERAGLGGRS
jgi:hypothetical protein